MYKQYRNQAKKTIERSAEELHICPRTLAMYESGEREPSPETIVAMSRVYGDRFLLLEYCWDRCPIGRVVGCKVEKTDMATATLRLLKDFNEAVAMQNNLICITSDGVIDRDERPELELIRSKLRDLVREANRLLVLTDQFEPGNHRSGTKKEAALAA